MTRGQIRAIAHRIEVAATFADETGRPAYARKLREDAATLRAIAGGTKKGDG